MKILLILISSFALTSCPKSKPTSETDYLEISFKLTSSAIHIGTVLDSNILSVCVDSMKLCDDRPQILRLPEGDFIGTKFPETSCVEFDLGGAFDLVTMGDFVVLNICF